jgi:tetratricopeptide (TPR) repeat protein
MHDRRGNPITASTPQSVEAVDHFAHELLASGPDVMGILNTSDADPDCALAHVWAAVLQMLFETGASRPAARRYLDRAYAAPQPTDYERVFIGAVAAWIDEDDPACQAAFETLASSRPTFLAGIRIGQLRQVYRGDWLGHLKLIEGALPANADDPYALGMYAFALEQCHRLDDAERAAERALTLLPSEPWSQHALAHVHDSRGQPEAGLRLMAGAAPDWRDRNVFIQSHNRWHRALFAIDAGRPELALDWYDREISGVAPDFSGNQVDSVALLVRLEAQGLDVGERWNTLADHLRPRAAEHVEPFNDIHFAYGLARAGRPQAHAYLASLHDHAATRPAWRAVCLPIAEAVMAHGRGDWAAAADRLTATQPLWPRLGGSHAQRDLLAQLLMDALIRAARWNEAAQWLERRWRERPQVGWPAAKLALVYDRAGLPRAADWARAEARRLPAGRHRS